MDIIAADAKIPALGLGTWQLTGEDCVRTVSQALSAGYRHIDTAQMYGNEEEVGQGIANSGVLRDDLWLTTKLDNEMHSPDEVRRSLRDSLRRLGVDHVDLLLIHWPVDLGQLEDTLGAMEQLHRNGEVRHLGVSNFTAEQVNRAADRATIVTNQVEYHPFIDQTAVRGVLADRGMALTAYSPLARRRAMDDAILAEIAAGRGHTPAQVALRWLLDHGDVVAIPKTTSESHLKANLEVLEHQPLSDAERAQIEKLPKDGRVIDPPFAPDWD